jgi:hypothetical protein
MAAMKIALFVHLPDDLCLSVADFLPAEDVTSVLKVCKSWNQIAGDPLWRILLARDYSFKKVLADHTKAYAQMHGLFLACFIRAVNRVPSVPRPLPLVKAY